MASSSFVQVARFSLASVEASRELAVWQAVMSEAWDGGQRFRARPAGGRDRRRTRLLSLRCGHLAMPSLRHCSLNWGGVSGLQQKSAEGRACLCRADSHAGRRLPEAEVLHLADLLQRELHALEFGGCPWRLGASVGQCWGPGAVCQPPLTLLCLGGRSASESVSTSSSS